MTRNNPTHQPAVSNRLDTRDGLVDWSIADRSTGGIPWSTTVDRTEVIG
ncbi:hypothetical protein [Natrinema halophilum]|uniref:Uncharacterized protein n=1 Tax=Natrinema halophilum TaxID=1699371 RepID=A0A7D5GJQ2_9EURY|nr:hypothetical protein [Natrinema halophilum]QLG50767.1 hypothetical protein HYG82_18950 [Natrinema halophilum]